MLIEFISLLGPHSGENLAGAFLKCIKDFGIQTKVCRKEYFIYSNRKFACFRKDIYISNYLLQVLAITTDNASNNNVLFQTIQEEFNYTGLNSPPIQHIHCLAHIINLAVQAFLTCLKAEHDDVDTTECGEISKLQMIITKIQSSSQHRENFARQYKMFRFHNPKELVLDVKT